MDNEMKLDSARIENGQFVFKGTFDFPEVYGLSFHPSTSPQIAPFFLEPGKINITIDLQDWEFGSVIRGGQANLEYQEFKRIQEEKIINELHLLRSESQHTDGAERQMIDFKIAELYEQNNELTLDYIRSNPESPVSIFLLAYIFFGLDSQELGEILTSFSPSVKQTTVYLEIRNFYDTQVALEQRTPAFNYSEEIEDINIEFDAENIIQTLVGLNQGKPIYLKIWGSWCVPCKKEFPYLRELQSKINTADLIFAYFCVLSPENDWRILIQEEDLKGQHFLMSKELSEALLAKLQDRTVPKYVLIDKNGSIIDMNAPKPSDDRILALLNEMIK